MWGYILWRHIVREIGLFFDVLEKVRDHHDQYHYCKQQDQITLLTLVPSMPIIDHQILLKQKENIYRNSTYQLRHCVALFLHLIGIYY